MFFLVLFFNEDLLCCQGSSIPLDLVESCSTQRQRANKYKVYLQIILLCFELQNIVVVFQERKQQQPRTTMSPNLTKKTKLSRISRMNVKNEKEREFDIVAALSV